MLPEKLKNILVPIARRLNEINLPWMLVGGANLSLQSISDQADSIVISMKADNEQSITRIMDDARQVGESDTENGRILRFLVGKTEIEFILESNHGIYLPYLSDNNLSHIAVEDVEVPCLNLECEARVSRDSGQAALSQSIREFLATKK